ncbi:hypothetical protein Fmac_033046 [Flemingia macrophylla]|uniref:GDSL esterase/lipase EXL3 n=1 Tax=Flemingia macrophylla TaxID=520843 RepID=A0ABD1L6N1_9FABA
MVHLKTLVAVLILVFCAMSAPKTSADNNGGVPALFSFGDSILDTGNNNLLITLTKGNYPPYGRDFPGGIPTGRFCNGRNPSDLIAEALGVKATVPAYLGGSLRDEDLPTGVTFASGGSGIDPVTSGIQGVLSLSSQLRLFEQYIERLKALVGEERASYIVSHALVLYSSGNNDIAITYYDTLTHLQPFSIYSDGLVSGSSKFIMSLYGLGVRRMWVFSTLPLGCLPGGRTIAGGPLRFCAPIVNLQAQFFNAKLASAVSSIRSRYPDFDIRVCRRLRGVLRDCSFWSFRIMYHAKCVSRSFHIRFLGFCASNGESL